MADTSFTPEERDELLEIIRAELLEVFKEAKLSDGRMVSNTQRMMGNVSTAKHLIRAVEKRMRR